VTIQFTDTNSHSRRQLRSAAALLLGLVVVFVLSLGTDQVFHLLNVYPPWGQPMYETGLNLLSLSYRIIYAVVGSFIAAWFAPHSPMRHAMALGMIGLALSLVAALAAISMSSGPNWFPIALVLTALPCAWLGGILYRRTLGAPR
jgi:hypothetical protein